MSFTSGTSKWQDLLSQQRSPQADRELIDAVVAGGARAHRLWTHGVELFEHGAERAELPPGWEQRVDQGSGRIFFVSHARRTTSWRDPRTAAAAAAEVAADDDAALVGDADDDAPAAAREPQRDGAVTLVAVGGAAAVGADDASNNNDAPRLGVALPAALTSDDHVLALHGLGWPARKCAAALRACGGDAAAAARRLEAAAAARAGAAPRSDAGTGAVEALCQMGFGAAQSRRALERCAYDMQRAAELLLEEGFADDDDDDAGGGDGDDDDDDGDGATEAPAAASSAPPADSSAAASSSAAPSVEAAAVGDTIDVCDEVGLWHEARVVATDVDGGVIRIVFVGWSEHWAEWLDRASPRLRPRSGEAATGPETVKWVADPDADAAAAAAAAAAEGGSDRPASSSSSSSSSGRPRGRAWWGGRRPSSSSSSGWKGEGRPKQRPPARAPSAAADFYPADAGVTRVTERAPDEEEEDDDEEEEGEEEEAAEAEGEGEGEAEGEEAGTLGLLRPPSGTSPEEARAASAAVAAAVAAAIAAPIVAAGEAAAAAADHQGAPQAAADDDEGPPTAPTPAREEPSGDGEGGSGGVGVAVGGPASDAELMTRSELYVLGSGCLLPTTARLSRRAALQLQAVRATLATTLPEAAGPERQRRPVGYALLRERRARLLQAAHAALVRERTRGDAAAVGWREAYDAQRAKEPKPSGGKLVHWALESLGRHAVAELCTNYSTWFHTRSHLVRVNSVLKKLTPLQLHGHAAAAPVAARLHRHLSALAARTPDAVTTDADLLAFAAAPSAAPPDASPPPAALASPRTPAVAVALSPRSSSREIASRSSEGASSKGPTDGAADALRALLRLALVRGELSDQLVAARALAGGWSAGRKGARARICDAVDALSDLRAACEGSLAQRGLAPAHSAALGALGSHPALGTLPCAELPSRAALLAAGRVEAPAAAALLLSVLAEAAVGTVWGVGPWEHDFTSLASDPPPGEIAAAVALAVAEAPNANVGAEELAAGGAAGGRAAALAAAAAAASKPARREALPLHAPLCVDVSPSTLRLLIVSAAEALEALAAAADVLCGLAAGDAAHATRELSLAYACLALLRLLKVHLHFTTAARISLDDLGLSLRDDSTNRARSPESPAPELPVKSSPAASRAAGKRRAGAADDGAGAMAAAAAATASAVAAAAEGAEGAPPLERAPSLEEEEGEEAPSEAGSSMRGASRARVDSLGSQRFEADEAAEAAVEEDEGEEAKEEEGVSAEAGADDGDDDDEDEVAAGAGAGAPLMRRLRRLLLCLACGGDASWADPALGTALGESLAAEAIAVLQVGRAVFFASAAERRALLLLLLDPPPSDPADALSDPDAVDAADAAAVDESAAILEIDPSAVGAAVAPGPSSKGGGGAPGHRTRARSRSRSSSGGGGFGGPSARALLADSLIASFAKEPGAISQLLAPSGDAEGAATARLLHCLSATLANEAAAAAAAAAGAAAVVVPRRAARGPSAALRLASACFWELLSRASFCMSADEPEPRALLRCARLLLGAARDALAPPATPERGSVLELLPLVASGLSLFASFGATFAAEILPDLVPLVAAAHAVAADAATDSPPTPRPVPAAAVGTTLQTPITKLSETTWTPLRLSGATGEFAMVNGEYTNTTSGIYNGRPIWRKDRDCAIYWAQGWKVSRSGNLLGWCFTGGDGEMPAVGAWATVGCKGEGALVLSVDAAAPVRTLDVGSKADFEAAEDFELQPPAMAVESRHPHTTSCYAEHTISAPASPCLWLKFDPRCATAEGEASVQLWADGKLVHAFAGPQGQTWPRAPLVLPHPSVTLRFRAHGSGKPKGAWGFAVVAHGFEPSLAPSSLPSLVDSRRALACIAAKYAAVLLVGDPLSPEERAHAAALAAHAADDGSGAGPSAPRGVPLSLLDALAARRRRRATSRIDGLEGVDALLDAATDAAGRRHVVVALADGLRAVQGGGSDGGSDGALLPLEHGTSGCGAALASRLRECYRRLFRRLAALLRAALDARADDEIACVANAYALRLHVSDHALFDDSDVVSLLRQLRAADDNKTDGASTGKTGKALCRRLFAHLALAAFAPAAAAAAATDLSDLQTSVLALLREMGEEAGARLLREMRVPPRPPASAAAAGADESGVVRLLGLLMSLTARPAVARELGSGDWLAPLLSILRVGPVAAAPLALRLLRSALPAAADPAFLATAAAGLARPSGFKDAEPPKPFVRLLLEALGREVAGDAPLVAIGGGRRGAPGGAAAAELVSLVRSLQRGTGGFYAASWRAQALDELKSALLLAHHYDADSAAADAAPADGAAWVLIGAVCVLGGHVPAVHAGGRCISTVDAVRAHAAVLAVGSDSLLISSESAEPLAPQLVPRALAMASEDLEPSWDGMDLAPCAAALTALLPRGGDLAPGGAWGAAGGATPLVALLRARASKAVHTLLLSARAEAAASALLAAGALPRLVEAAAAPTPLYGAAARQPPLAASEELSLAIDAALADALPDAAAVAAAVGAVPPEGGAARAEPPAEEPAAAPAEAAAAAGAAATPAEAAAFYVGRRLRINTGRWAGRVGVVAAPPRGGRVRLSLAAAEGGGACVVEVPTVTRADDPLLEPPERRAGVAAAAAALRGRPAGSLVRLGCAVHHAAATMRCRHSALLLLCEPAWLHAADADAASPFALASIPPLPTLLHLLKLAARDAAADVAALGGSETLNVIWVVLSALLHDRRLPKHAPSYDALADSLVAEALDALARAATAVQTLESAHPSEVATTLQRVECPGAAAVHLHLDARTQLPRGARLAVFLDASCERELFRFAADDLPSAESLGVPASTVFVRYTCDNNREHAWGYKLRVAPLRWRARHEGLTLAAPLEHAWEVLQLLLDAAPARLLRPRPLASFLWYLQHGAAPEKERLCALIVRALPAAHLGDVGFEWGGFGSLERQVGWHEEQQAAQPATPLLPHATQAILDLLIHLRERLVACALPLWESTLPCLADAAELSALSRYLLHPAGAAAAPPPPEKSWKHALRASRLHEEDVEPHALFARWTPEADAQLMRYVDGTLQPDSAFNVRPAALASLADSADSAYPRLSAAPPRARALRYALLQRFNQLVLKLLPLVHTGGRDAASLGGRLGLLRGLVFMEVKLGALQRTFAASATDADPIPIALNRHRAAKPRADANEKASHSVFAQLCDQLAVVPPRALCRHDKAFRVNFVGEAADDHGGPYREALAQICAELHSDTLPLLVRSPNCVHGAGGNREVYVPNPSALGAHELDWYCFVGQLLGLALRQRETQLALSLPSVVWKQLVGEPLGTDDLDGFDAMCRSSLDALRHIDRDGVDASTFADVIFETFTTRLSDGTAVELLAGGEEVPVTWENRSEYCDAVAQARLGEAQRQCDALLQGLSYMVPQRLLALFTWRQLEVLTCGTADVDVDVLRAHTKYGVGVSPNQRHVRHFWAALRRFTPEQRSLFLRFVWGRARLPVGAADWGDSKLTIHAKHSASPDSMFPIAHTCFFSLELPAYTTAAICHARLLYAITHCQDIDVDTTSGARENRDAAVEDEDDE